MSAYCSVIHGGLHLNIKDAIPTAQHCCQRDEMFPVDTTTNFWNSDKFIPLRELNKQNIWDPQCVGCRGLEQVGLESERTGMNNGLKIMNRTNLSGPARIDILFDNSCNLACRTCEPSSSTYWQKHLKANNLWKGPISAPKNKADVIAALKNLDLSNLRMVVFCGGETLLGQEYWDVAEWLADNVPNAKEQLTVCFQTNGTQPILERNHAIIDRFHLVKLHFSIDGVGARFNYLRWPANWNEVTENIFTIRDTAPSNVMFLVEETVSIFNLAYLGELATWVDNNFTTNREGDIVNHTQHVAHGIYKLNNLTQEYVDATTKYRNLVPPNWRENPVAIRNVIAEIKKFDSFRNENFAEVFPEVANYYSRYL